jgi:Skp family chaperone for outer membrane proteins
MNFTLKTAVAAILAVSLSSYAYAGDPPAPAKKHAATRKTAKPKGPTVEEQIQSLRQDMETQINGLKSDLAAKDAQLKQAQQAAADAQTAAAKAQDAANVQQQAVTENAAAVSTLQSTVTDMKTVNASVVSSITDETAAIKKSISNPSTLHYKGITLTPGGYLAGETVYRSKATGGDIPTAFNAIPYEHADAYSMSEFFGDARQSRVTLMAEGKTNWGMLRGYYEADWLGTGISSNNNQSNSYVMRERVLWAQAETNNHWAFTGGQLWSLATEDKKGLSNLSGDIMTPQTIDPNYVVGFVWTRQYGFRVTKTFNRVAFGLAAEDPQVLYTASLAGNTPYAVIGSAGNNGGNYNAAVSGCTPATSVVNYTDQTQTDSAGNTIHVAVPVYKTVNGCSNIANLSFNVAPDVIAKVALDPGWGHYEIFGIGRFAHQTVYPGETTNSNLYGGLTDVATGTAVAPALSTAGSFSNSIFFGGGGASLRVPVIANILSVGVKGMYGPGLGRYGNSTLADLTTNSWGGFSPIHNASTLVTVEANPNPRLMLYLNYGADYAGRDDWGVAGATTSLGGPSADFCYKANGTTTCGTSASAAAIAAGGKWGGHWGSPSNAAVGYGSRLLSNSGCLTTSNPGYNGGASTGYAPGGSCGAQTRDVQEITGGYWYDIYKGDRGRLRQSFQYGYAVREGWSGAPVNGVGIGAKGIDNMFWTSFRYYLP